MDRTVSTTMPPLAVIGIGCLFPGSSDFAGFWARVVGCADSIREVPSSHWRADDYLNPDPKAPDRVYAARGGFLDPVPFHPQAFGIPPSNLEATDASQLLGLLVAQQALDDCGYVLSGEAEGKKRVDRSRVSVILGVTGTLQLVIPLGARLGHPLWRKALREAGVEDAVAEDVVQRIADGYVPWQENSFPGLLGNVVAGRIANRFDFGGTNCVVDAACASSLSAIHLAAMELATGRSDMVLTGGVDTFNDIFMFTCFSKTPALSPTGNARPFDAAGDGTVLGEGLGMVVLKRLDDARRDGDRIYAVLRGVGSSSDGKGNAIYAPKKEGQIEALSNAYRTSGVSPDTIELVEAHGTGTKVGDATEVSALAEVYGKSGRSGPWCALGSIKSQIGHTKAAAGAAGLIKAAAALYHKVLPPTIKVSQPLEVLQEPGCPLYVNTVERPWMPPKSHPRRAAVSAFGFGGSNFHAVLEEADPHKPGIDWPGNVQLIALSGTTAGDLRRQLEAWPSDEPWEALRRRADESRRTFRAEAEWRLVLVVEKDRLDLNKQRTRAQSLLDREEARSLPTEGIFLGRGAAGKLGVLFPGQGAQYVGMLREMTCHFPAAFDVFAEANAAFEASSERRLVDLVYPPPAFTAEGKAAQSAALRATEVAQPALGAVSLGAWRVLEQFGVRAEAFAGHSYGELTALAAAGWLDEASFYRLSQVRGRLMAEAGKAQDAGAMLAVKASEEEIRRVLGEEGIDLVLANKNAPKQTVLSGSSAKIEQAATAFGRRSIGTVRLPVAAAFHSPLVSGAREPFAAVVRDVSWTTGKTVYANTSAAPYPPDATAAKELLAGQLAQPVEWVREITAMAEAGISEFLEVGPGGRLAGLVESILTQRSAAVTTFDPTQGQRSGWVDLAACLAWLSARGHKVELSQWDPVAVASGPPTKPGLQVELSGVNYVKPRAPRPPRTPVSPVRSEPAMEQTLHSNGTPRGDRPVQPQVQSQSQPKPQPQPPVTAVAPKPAANGVDATAVGRALDITRESLATLQRMQEQTAQLHRQFLEGQESAHRTVHHLVEQQHRLLQASLGLPISMPSVSSPAPAPAVVPVSAPIPAPRVAGPTSPVVSVSPAPVAAPTPVPIARPAPVAPAPPTPAASVASPVPVEQPTRKATGAVEQVLLEVIAEKTGYPAEMLELGMALDADLGIDSIKRVEILSALQEKLPDAPPVKPEHLGTLHTLRDIVAFLGDASPAPTSSGLQASAVEQVLLEVIAEKTGYPAEMLELGMALDADLGIDSIKRVEILSALQEKLPDAPPVKPEHLGTLHTLRDIVAFLGQGPSAAPSPVAVPAEQPVVRRETTPPAAPTRVKTRLERSVVRAVSLTEERAAASLSPGAEVWISEDGTELSKAVAARLRERGLTARIVAVENLAKGDPQGLILLGPARASSDGWLWRALQVVQQVGPSLRSSRGRLLTVARLDGAFGLGGGTPQREPLDGGLAGLAKTVGQEWSEVTARALDVAPEVSVEQSAAWIVEEFGLQGEVEVGLSPRGRVTLRREVETAEGKDTPFRTGDVVVISGGARGVTAEVAVALAEAYRPTLVLLGRSPEPGAASHELGEFSDEASLRREVGKREPGLSPRAVNDRVKSILAAREIQRTLTRIEAAGAKAIYRSVDVRDGGALKSTLAEIRRGHGPVRGVIHGAGVLADARIEDKTIAQFDDVYQTKVAGLRALLEAVGEDALRALVLFSSSTARFGRTGQVDYAIANEVLNKLAWQEASRRPGCQVVSVNWGPWDGGMVTAGLKQLFAREGVDVIPLEAGAKLLVDELRLGPRGPREIVVLARNEAEVTSSVPLPPALPTAFERVLELADYPVLNSHVLNGRPVLPTVLMLEWLAHAALVQNPGLAFHGCDDLRILHGVQLDGEAPTLRVGAGKAVRRDGFFVAPVELRSVRSGGKEVLHARAEIVLANSLPPAPEAQPLPEIAAYSHSPADAYRQGLLFHGPMLQGIERIEGCGEAGIVGLVRSAPSAVEWMRQPLRQHWLSDPLILDGAFQLVILWTQDQRGAGSLPCHLTRYRQYRRGFPSTGSRVVVSIERAGDLHALADIELLDREGQLLARLEGYECVIDANLAQAFRQNAPATA